MRTNSSAGETAVKWKVSHADGATPEASLWEGAHSEDQRQAVHSATGAAVQRPSADAGKVRDSHIPTGGGPKS